MSAVDAQGSGGGHFPSSPNHSPHKRLRGSDKDIKPESPTKKQKKDSNAARPSEKVKNVANEWFAGIAANQGSPDVSPVRQQFSSLRASDKENPPTAVRRKLSFEEPTTSERITKVLAHSLPEKKPLSQREREKIAELVEYHFNHSEEPFYLYAAKSGAARDLVIDPRKQCFIVVSGDHGDLYVEGAERIVSAATGFTVKGDKIETTKLVHLYTLDPDTIDDAKRQQEQISDDLYYEDQFLTIEYESEDEIEQYSGFEVRYDGGNIEKVTLKPQEIRVVLRDVAKSLSFLHGNNLSHGDVTRGNIVIRNREQGQLHAKLIDFGMTFSLDESDDDWQKQVDDGYGSVQYSAPECFGMSEKLEEIGDQHVAEEMFAVGCLLYSMLYPKSAGWFDPVTAALVRNTDDARNKAASAFEISMQKLTAEKKNEPVERQTLIDICLALLHKDPQERMSLATLQTLL